MLKSFPGTIYWPDLGRRTSPTQVMVMKDMGKMLPSLPSTPPMSSWRMMQGMSRTVRFETLSY